MILKWKLALVMGGVVALSACGGSSGGDSTSSVQGGAATSSANVPAPGNVVAASTDVQQKVLVQGNANGFVAEKLVAALPVGNISDYDILVVQATGTLDSSQLAQVKSALAAGKEVVLDGDGSKTLKDSALLKEITGATIDVEAVRITQDQEGRGYYVTPVRTQAKAVIQASAQGAFMTNAEVAKSMNTVENVFGISANGGAQ